MKNKLLHFLPVLFALFALSANGAPMAFSVNSDSGNPLTDDSLFLVDLTTGSNSPRGELLSGVESRVDTEGLAIAPDGTLWGVDDDSLTLFPITANGAIRFLDEVSLVSFQIGGGNDFGMTFDCDNSLFITSVRTQTLHRLNLDGSSVIIGAQGALGINISAIAALGTPTQLYGLGNGQFQDGTTDNPNLYSIDVTTGVASLIGPLGAQAGDYNQAGLAFDADGKLWAITDRRIINNSIADLPSQILQIDVATGAATLMSTTTEIGFESLAIAPPSACGISAPSGNEFEGIPTLSPAGLLLAMIILLLAGLSALRRHYS